MRVGILGAGPVGRTLATKLNDLDHDVSIGTRTPRDGAVSYSEAARGAELVINATGGAASLETLAAAGAENVAGKVLIDVSNALDSSRGMPPRVGRSTCR
jgi:predicted dinucleotide-binding enzyme